MPFYLQMSKNLTQQRDIYDTVIFRFLQIFYGLKIYIYFKNIAFKKNTTLKVNCRSCRNYQSMSRIHLQTAVYFWSSFLQLLELHFHFNPLSTVASGNYLLIHSFIHSFTYLLFSYLFLSISLSKVTSENSILLMEIEMEHCRETE